jgi:thiamine kinase-like enzyme
MSSLASDRAALLPLLPEMKLGVVSSIEPLTQGLSGARVYAIVSSRGEFVLRVQARQLDQSYFAQQLRVLARASEAGVAPAVVHVDQAARAVVSVRIAGRPLPSALAEPSQRQTVLMSVVEALRALHAVDATDVESRDPLPFTRSAWQAARDRPGFPSWALALDPMLAEIAATLARDPRRVVSHNDVNPGNLLWDGARAWLVDWEVSGLGHPYYDLATLALFLNLDEQTAFSLAAHHDGAALNESARGTFRAQRRLVGLLSGLTFLGLVDDLLVRTAETVADAPSLSDCYAAFRTGKYDLQSQLGRASMALALLASAFNGD